MDAPAPGATATATAVHHVGMTVSNIEAALAFWEKFLGIKARWQTLLDRPYLGTVVGMPGVRIKAAFIDLPGGIVLELLDYQVADRRPNPDATQNPGNVHLCFAVEDAPAAWRHAVAAGARPVAPDGPVEIDGGPNKGARGSYLRVHDGITIELFQRPKASP
jgi:catechol 2,3-dioxygenase-like lactoylglutathione lyase family enzyme